MSNYIPLFQELDFKENNHTYTYKNISILPSVTKIMKLLSDEIYSHIDAEVLKFAAIRGTKVHYATELFDDGIYEIEQEYENYLIAYKNFTIDYDPEILAVESKVYHKQLMYAGTIDRVVKINSEIILLDIKTTAVIQHELVSVQVSAYADALLSHGIKIDKLASLNLCSDGTYVFKYLEDNFEIFRSLYQVHMFKQKIKN